jgi:hypothetical protein
MVWTGLNTGEIPFESACNQLLGSTRDGSFVDHLSDYQLLKKNYVLLNYLNLIVYRLGVRRAYTSFF